MSVPNDPRLPNAGSLITIQDVNADVFSLPAQNYVTAASNFGKEWQHWNGADSFILYGRGGELATDRVEDQEIIMLCLHLLQNCIF